MRRKIITSKTKKSNICTTHIFTVHLCQCALAFAKLHSFLKRPVENKLGRQPLKAVVRGSAKGFLSTQQEGGNISNPFVVLTNSAGWKQNQTEEENLFTDILCKSFQAIIAFFSAEFPEAREGCFIIWSKSDSVLV